MNGSEKIALLLSGAGLVVLYEPLRSEVSLAPFNIPTPNYCIPPRASLDPLEEARKVIREAEDNQVALLIPGRYFDATGTRHGQGGGWYDRFLAAVPREWLRIGICYDDQFSSAPLVRESWDQAMDYVAVVNRESGEVTLYSTDAPHD